MEHIRLGDDLGLPNEPEPNSIVNWKAMAERLYERLVELGDEHSCMTAYCIARGFDMYS